MMRFNERSLVVLIAGVVVAAVAAALVWSLLLRDGDDDESGAETASGAPNASRSFAGGSPEVLLLSGRTLVRRDLEEGTEDLLTDIPSPDVRAAPGSPWLAYVTPKKAKADEDFAAEPVLHLYDVEAEERHKHGPGVAPVWNAAGTHVAFLRPVEPRDCVAEACSGDVQIGVIAPETGDEELLLDPGRYTVLGWAADRVLVSDFEKPSEVISVSLDDERNALDMPASQFWGASPDGEWVIKTNAKKTEFIAMDDGKLGKKRIPVELEGHELLEGAWAHDSSMVAAVTRHTTSVPKGKNADSGRRDSTTQVVTFSPEEPRVELLESTYGATGSLLWGPANDAVVFASLVDPKKALFQAKHCPLGSSAECSIVTSWTEGVALLRAE